MLFVKTNVQSIPLLKKMPAISKLSSFSPEILSLIQKQTAKNFGYGFTISTALSLISYIQNLLKTNGKPTDYKKHLTNMIRTGSFLASWSGFYQLFIRLLEKNLDHPNAFAIVASGFASGFSSMYLTQGVSWSLSLYILIRSLYSWYMIKIDKFPSWIQNFSPILIYCLLNVGLGFMSQLQIKYLDNSYSEFLSHCAGFNRRGMIEIYKTNTLKECHPHFHKDESCFRDAMSRNVVMLSRLLKIYVPFYFVSSFFKGAFFNLSLEKQKKAWISLLKNVSRSTLFLLLQCFVCGPCPCIHNYLTKQYNPLIIAAVWFFGSFAIYFESPSRVKEINLFTFWKLSVSFVNYVMDVKNYNPDEKPEKHSEKFNFWSSNIVFGLASALSLYCLSRNRQQLKSLDRTILVSLFPESLMK